MWISLNRVDNSPVYIGVYYGKQESTSLEAIQEEYDNLTEEILEMKARGELIVCMDGNAKIGLMGEEMSRNGRLMMEMLSECEVEIMNNKETCSGVITRQNRKNEDEKSAIDFVIATYRASLWVKSLIIDEAGVYRLKSKNESDHNTIIINMEIDKINSSEEMKRTDWNYKASEEKWEEFRREIEKSVPKAKEIMTKTHIDMTQRYTKWERLIYSAAIKTIGRTTYKNRGEPKSSNQIKTLRKERAEYKKEFEKEKDQRKKGEKLKGYIQKQKEIRELLEKEEKEKTKIMFDRMIKEANNGGFWKERRKLNRDETPLWMVTKDEHGRRILDPEENKENVAKYYENLYRNQHTPYHPYHLEVKETVSQLSKGEENDGENDAMPTKIEVEEIIKKKKGKKATTDWRNDLVKRGGKPMVNLIMPVIEAFWLEETPPKQWNMGHITNIWKGKGDRESMDNQRGITVSSSIGTIPEETINQRMIKTIKFTQGQAGGQKGASSTDHIFILKNIMSIAKKEGRHLMISFFDVRKAFDHADMNDMLFILHKNGFRGKIWRLTKALNENLTAKIKTKHGLTREIRRDKGGKQGGKLMVPMFSKTMDTASEDLLSDPNLGIQIKNDKIPALLFMDDVLTLAEGYEQQQKTLDAIAEFGTKHQVEWGQEKCKVLEYGTHRESSKEWSLGEKTIENCQSYKYLGEVITRDGKNDENLATRVSKVKSSVRAINTCCQKDIMKKIEINVLITLHESVTLPALLYNAETWPLNKTIKKDIDKIEIWAWKSMLGLPTTTPNAAVMVCSGAMYASIRVQVKQLLYLHKVLQKEDDHWTKLTLKVLIDYDIGWAKQIRENLETWDLETNLETIRQKSTNDWKREVTDAAEKKNREQLLEECYNRSRTENKAKTKTKNLIPLLEDENYCRNPQPFMNRNNKLIARAYLMGRYGMLQCAANFSMGYGGKNCRQCGVIDDEQHRINNCEVWKDVNLFTSNEKINFKLLYSEDEQESLPIVEKILEMWDLGNNKNCMKVVTA